MTKLFRLSPNTLLKKLFNLKLERVFPRGFERYAVKGKNLIGAEIGVCEGEHALSLLKYLDIKKIYLIDPYTIQNNYDDYWRKNILLAKKRVQKMFGKNKNVKLIFNYSTEAIKDISDKLDFVYIDGDHSYSAVKEDILNYWQILKKGGVLGGHDVHNATRPHNIGVMKAVFEFALSKKLDVYIQGEDWWIKKI
jgi:hypothetical protein